MKWKSKRSYALQEILYFYDLEKPRQFGVPHQVLQASGTEVFKTHKPRIAPPKPGQIKSPFKVPVSTENFFNLQSTITRVLSDILHR